LKILLSLASFAEGNKMSIKLINKSEETEQDDIISMSEMKQLEVCVVIDGGDDGHVIMRTASIANFEVMDLTNPRRGSCWLDINNAKYTKVRRLRKGEKYLLELS